MYAMLISAEELLAHLHNPDWVVIDCRFSLQEVDKGREDYLDGHIPGAIYADLDTDLSGTVIPGKTSRHPFPPLDRVVALFSSWGIDEKVQVVVHDFKGGGIAARLWWMLRWLGHEKVAILDGGWGNWKDKNYPGSVLAPDREARQFIPRKQEGWTMDVDEVKKIKGDPEYRLVDSRNYERYIGQEEPIDPVAGHIPGAINLPFMDNVDENGFLRSPDILRPRFEKALGEVSADHTVFYCGSGVTSCHNIFVMDHLGLGMARLYPGSWSEWIVDPNREVATGVE